MKRRDFLQFMGVSAAATTASVALAKIPEAESQIILLDKPKEIIQAKTIPDVDFIISEGLISIEYNDERSAQMFDRTLSEDDIRSIYNPNPYNLISVDVEAYAIGNTNLMQINAFDTFSFDFGKERFDAYTAQKYDSLYQLNGRKFKVIGHTVAMNVDTITTVSIRAKEIL